MIECRVGEAVSGGQRRTRPRWIAVVAIATSTLLAATPIGPAAADDGVRAEVDSLDVLQLGCAGDERDDQAFVACRWAVPDGAIGVRVIRLGGGSGTSRDVVHRTSNPWSNTFIDADIRRGIRYVYVVQAVGATGQVVAMSRPAVAGVAPRVDPIVEVLRLDCAATGEVASRCAWSAPTAPARTLTLWRSVDGAIRERVASFAQPFPTSYGDVVPGSTSHAVYAVIATDGAGEIVARSRPRLVEFAAPSPTVTATSLPSVPARVPAPSTTVPSTTVPSTTVPSTTVPSTTVPSTTVPSSTIVTPIVDRTPISPAPATTAVPAVDRDVEVDSAPAATRPEAAGEARAESAAQPVRVAGADRERAD